MAVEYREEPCRTALNRVKGMPFAWSLNPYTGCVHRCTFCYVRAFEQRADRPADDRYGRTIRVKTNVADVLRAELARRSWAREEVTIGAATDPYQPAEGRYRLTRACIVELGRARTPTSIITRGPLVWRDVDVLQEAARRAEVSSTSRCRRSTTASGARRSRARRLRAAPRDRPAARRCRDRARTSLSRRSCPASPTGRSSSPRPSGSAPGRCAPHLGRRPPPPAGNARALPRGAGPRLALGERPLRAAVRGPKLPPGERDGARAHPRRRTCARARERRQACAPAAAGTDTAHTRLTAPVESPRG